MVSITAIGILLYTIPFCIIALHSLREYLNDKGNPQKKHVFYAFAAFSVGFLLDLIGALLVAPDMNPTRIMAITVLFTLFDAFNIIGVFWLFIFLKDFLERMTKYIIPALAQMLITLAVIFATPAGFQITAGTEYIIERAGIHSFAILFFWFLYWGEIARQFWKHSRLITDKVAMRRSQTMALGAVFAVLAYICVVLAEVNHSMAFVLTGEVSAIASGVVFYAGFVAPKWLKRIWGKVPKLS